MTLLEKAKTQVAALEAANRHIAEAVEWLHELGVFKPGEEQRTLHARGCPWREGGCSCPGGPELVFADWDEATPSRWLYLNTPERFHAANQR